MPFDREAYNSCMKKYLTGGGDRRRNFCVGAKVCSGKAASEQEAEQICAQPRPPKPVNGRRGVKCLTRVDDIVDCLVKNTDFRAQDIASALRTSIPMCVCGKKQIRAQKEEARLAMPPEQRQALDMMGQMQQEYGTTESVHG